MSTWPSDGDLHAGAELIAQKFFELIVHTNPTALDTATEWLARNGPMLRQRCETFTTLDPQKAMDEMERLQRTARAVAYDLSEPVKSSLKATHSHLSDWLGPAADAFRHQLTNIEVFTNRHAEFVTKAAATMGASLAVAVHVRRDYLELANKTAATIDKVIADDAAAAGQFLLKIGGGIAKTVIGAMADPRTALATVAQGAIDFAVETVDYSVKGADFNEVLASYRSAEDRLRADYETELDSITDELRRAEGDLADENFSMYRPLPSTTDVSSPDFRYEHFFTKERIPDDGFNQRVEAERKEMEPGGTASADASPIRRRLVPEEGQS